MLVMVPLAYNSNLHPAESCEELIGSLQAFALPLREQLQWQKLGVDFRIGSQEIAELQNPQQLSALRRCIDQCQLSVHTLNGFPLSPFQVAVVKDQAYHPDWTSQQRLQESIQLIEYALALSDEKYLSISTSPGTFKPWGVSDPIVKSIAENIGHWIAAAAMVYRSSGRRVQLALEPEPWCLLEHSQEVLAFWSGPLQQYALPVCLAALDNDLLAAQQALKDHVGICFDTCHVSLAFEDQAAVVNKFVQAGIPIAKCQFSAALEVRNPQQQPEAVAQLAAMHEPKFLHQTAARNKNGSLVRVCDLDQLDDCLRRMPDAESVRSHFHIPVFWPAHDHGLSSTIDESIQGLRACVAAGVQHIAVETYTWSVLSEREQDSLEGSLSELQFLERLIGGETSVGVSKIDGEDGVVVKQCDS
ncbi:MAG: metabolite traffic protein EboE [Planctomycetes bacterium]|nr:metabolite traffic protein EboE [Planctomycetota bacterium]